MFYFLKINTLIFILLFGLQDGNAAEKKNAEPLNFSFEDFTVMDNAGQNQESERLKINQVQSHQNPTLESEMESGKSYLDEFFDKSLQTFEDLKKTGSKFIKDLSQSKESSAVKPLPKEDLAKNFPDPFFYDAIYNKNNKFITYAYIYNDKTNKDNSYIPRIYNYKIEVELLKLAKSSNDRSKFYELFNASREDKNFNINFGDKFGNTMLLTALRNGNLEIFYFLLGQSANPDICNKSGICPIHVAIHAYNTDLVRVLCNNNVDVRIKDINGIMPLQFAMFNDLEDIFDIMLKAYLKYPINRQEREELLEFANEGSFVKYYKKMKRVF